jgi:hypothetical protein
MNAINQLTLIWLTTGSSRRNTEQVIPKIQVNFVDLSILFIGT